MITPEIPEELIEKMTRAYWNIAPAADYDVRASKPVEEVKAAVRDNLTVALSAVYSEIRAQAFDAAVQAIEKEYPPYGWELQPDGRLDTGREAYGEGLHTAVIAVRSLAGKETP